MPKRAVHAHLCYREHVPSWKECLCGLTTAGILSSLANLFDLTRPRIIFECLVRAIVYVILLNLNCSTCIAVAGGRGASDANGMML
jgi:hypothetical protein